MRQVHFPVSARLQVNLVRILARAYFFTFNRDGGVTISLPVPLGKWLPVLLTIDLFVTSFEKGSFHEESIDDLGGIGSCAFHRSQGLAWRGTCGASKAR